jgi:hypothetical protein
MDTKDYKIFKPQRNTPTFTPTPLWEVAAVDPHTNVLVCRVKLWINAIIRLCKRKSNASPIKVWRFTAFLSGALPIGSNDGKDAENLSRQ